MTIKTFFKPLEFSENEKSGDEEKVHLEHLYSNDKWDTNINEIYYNLKSELHSGFYMCILDKDTFKDFKKFLMPNTNVTDNCKCGCPLFHKINSCKDRKKWIRAHEQILNSIYTRYFKDLRDYDSFITYFMMNSSPCSCDLF